MSDDIQFNVQINNSILKAHKGELLSDALLRAGYYIPHPCSGRGVCGKCRVKVNGADVLSCEYRIFGDVSAELYEAGEISSASGLSESLECTENMCYVLDIGTTTLALALVSLDDKKAVKIVTKTNPQATFGADIMSRIRYCTENSQDILRGVLIGAVEEMLSELCVGRDLKLFAVGNVTMLHIFLGEDCRGIGAAPYTPSFLERKLVPPFLRGVSEIEALPSIHSFAGADLVAGMHSIGFPAGEGYNLLVDLGTNAELVLFSKEKIYCTSAAAGPCFEGADIECGMNARDGAVFSVFALEDGTLSFETAADKEPCGICGSGLVDLVALLLDRGVIDESGYMKTEKYYLTEDVYLSLGDVRAFQLAKSAICSAILCLLERAEVSFDDIDRLFISGGFSAGINTESAVRVGLLPQELAKKCRAVHNSALAGGVKYAAEPTDLGVYTNEAEYIDLSSNESFSKLFIENMSFAKIR